MTQATILDPKTKYMLMYATNVKLPRGEAPSELKHFRSAFGLFLFVIRDKQARAAIIADRYYVAKIEKSK